MKYFDELPLLGILRGICVNDVEPLFQACFEAGLRTIEITMNTNNAGDCIKKAVTLFGNKLEIGAGTVTSMDRLKIALDAGAEFIVMPIFDEEIVEHCVIHKIPVFPGAFTPQEVYRAWISGAHMVKLFPSKFFGPDYIKELKGPFDDIKIMACGGVNLENMSDYLAAGANAIAFGDGVFKKDLLKAKEFYKIKTLLENYITQFKILAK